MMIESMKKTLAFLDARSEAIEQISLEDELYNELYLSMREMRNQVRRIIKAQHKIECRTEESSFWDGMRELRKPDKDFSEPVKKTTKVTLD